MEADGLRWSLLVIGSLVIAGLAIHGIWISRKNSEKKSSGNKKSSHQAEQEYQPGGWSTDPEISDEILVNDELADSPEINFDIDQSEPASMEVNQAGASHDSSSESANNSNEFDELGLGAVRVVSSAQGEDAQKVEESDKFKDHASQLEQGKDSSNPESSKVDSSSKIYASVVTQPKPEYAKQFQSLAAETVAISQQEKAQPSTETMAAPRQASPMQAAPRQVVNSSPTIQPATTNELAATEGLSNQNYQAPEPPASLLRKEPEVTETSSSETAGVNAPETKVEDEKHTTLAEKLSLTEQARNLVKRKKAESGRKRREPKIAEDQMRIDFDDEPLNESQPEPQKVDKKAEEKTPKQQQEVLVLNVKMADNESIAGSALLPMLLTLGFKFGDQDIFHRHVNSNGKGPVLFSLANMFKPGNFDIDSLENFTTQGVSLFMILPIEGDPHQVFNMMHNAARKIADEFSAQIYDAKRTLLTKQSLQQYVEKIREFERQRLLAR